VPPLLGVPALPPVAGTPAMPPVPGIPALPPVLDAPALPPVLAVPPFPDVPPVAKMPPAGDPPPAGEPPAPPAPNTPPVPPDAGPEPPVSTGVVAASCPGEMEPSADSDPWWHPAPTVANARTDSAVVIVLLCMWIWSRTLQGYNGSWSATVATMSQTGPDGPSAIGQPGRARVRDPARAEPGPKRQSSRRPRRPRSARESANADVWLRRAPGAPAPPW